MADRLCRPENVRKLKGMVKTTDPAKLAALNKHSRKAVESGAMVLMTVEPRPKRPGKPERKVQK